MTIVCIRQPGYIPFSGFFKKIQTSDVFVLLDDVQFEKNDWDNRNKIRTSEGNMWLTVPILHKFGQRLNEIKIANLVLLMSKLEIQIYMKKLWLSKMEGAKFVE